MVDATSDSAFGRYRVLRRLAVGGMGEIYLAHDEMLDRRVALKHLRQDLRRDEVLQRMFLEEARAMARIDHPHIVRIFDIGVADERYFMALEWLKGWDLWRVFKRQLQRGERLPLPIVLQLVLDTCAALEAAHAATTADGTVLNLVHRDINPKNLFVTTEGVLKVLDFGVVKTAVQGDLTSTGTVKGTVEYFSPEQCQGETLDQRSDLFSLGVVLHEQLSGAPLFRRSTLPESLTAIVEEPLLPPARPGEPLPERLVQITMRALQRRRALRYADATSLAAELRGVIEEVGAPAREEISRCCARLFPDDPEGEHPEQSPPDELPITSPSRAPEATVKEERTERLPAQGARPARAHEERTERLAYVHEEKTERRPPPASTLAAPEVRPPEESTERLPGPTPEAPAVERPVEVTVRDAVSPPTEATEEARATRSRSPSALVYAGAAALGLVALLLALWPSTDDEGDGTGGADAAAVAAASFDAGVAPTDRGGRGDHEVRRDASSAAADSASASDAAVASRDADRVLKRAAGAGPRRDARPRTGRLTLDSVPWAEVYIGGKLIGPTPLMSHPVPAGRVRVRLRNPERGIDHVENIRVGAGEHVKRRVDLSSR